MRNPGDVIRERYKIVSFIGDGRHGKIYKAHDMTADRDVSLKILDGPASANIDTKKRFIKEGEVLASLRHPAIARIYSLEMEGSLPFIVTEYIEGRSMAARKDELRRDLPALFRAFQQLLEGVEECHNRQVIHRDLKPTNLMIGNDGQLKIVDFGLAKTREKLTKPGVILGTPTYMSPEQCQGITSTEASDVYAIGIIFWEFLTGEVPFKFDEDKPESDFTKLLQHVTAPLPAERFDAVPRFAPLRGIVFDMLDKTPRMRPSIRRIMSVLNEITPGILAG